MLRAYLRWLLVMQLSLVRSLGLDTEKHMMQKELCGAFREPNLAPGPGFSSGHSGFIFQGAYSHALDLKKALDILYQSCMVTLGFGYCITILGGWRRDTLLGQWAVCLLQHSSESFFFFFWGGGVCGSCITFGPYLCTFYLQHTPVADPGGGGGRGLRGHVPPQQCPQITIKRATL